MPLLFYGQLRPGPKGRHLYTEGLRSVETKVFNGFRVNGFGSYPRLNAVANIWHWRPKKHTVISWHEDFLHHEQTVFLPGLLDQRDALELARVTFDRVIPSPILFRFRQDYHEVLLYD